MNSTELQKRFSSVYLEFISNADDVFALSHTVTLLGWTACTLWGTAFEQKIPLNCFLSIKKNKNKGIKFGKYLRYTEGYFENCDFDRFETPRESFLRGLEKLYPDAWCEISILNELPTKTPDIVSFLSILALEFSENEHFSLSEFNFELWRIYESELIRKLVRKAEAVRLEYNETTKWLSSMTSVFCGLSEWNRPIIHQADICLPLPRKDEAMAFSQSRLRKFRWTEARTILSGIETLPFEIMILHPKSVEKNSHWYWELVGSIIWADSIAGELDLAMFATSWSVRERWTIESNIKTILSCCEMLTLNAINGLKKYNEWKIVDSEQFWLFAKAHEWSKHILWKSNFENIDKEQNWTSAIRNAVQRKTRWDFLIFRTGSSIDMNYVILFSKKIPYSEILDVSIWLEDGLKNEFITILSSPKDWIGGINFWRFQLDDLFEIKPAEMIKIGRIGCKDREFRWVWVKEYSESNPGIVVDVMAWKIYGWWSRVTSKEIPSQQFASDILYRLLNEEVISSKNLPHSTYATSKNEMISKILVPLKKLSETLTWTEIDWIVEWTETEFRIKIRNPGELKIYIVELVW